MTEGILEVTLTMTEDELLPEFRQRVETKASKLRQKYTEVCIEYGYEEKSNSLRALICRGKTVQEELKECRECIDHNINNVIHELVKLERPEFLVTSLPNVCVISTDTVKEMKDRLQNVHIFLNRIKHIEFGE